MYNCIFFKFCNMFFPLGMNLIFSFWSFHPLVEHRLCFPACTKGLAVGLYHPRFSNNSAPQGEGSLMCRIKTTVWGKKTLSSDWSESPLSEVKAGVSPLTIIPIKQCDWSSRSPVVSFEVVSFSILRNKAFLNHLNNRSTRDFCDVRAFPFLVFSSQFQISL